MNNYFKPIIAEDLDLWKLFSDKSGNVYCIGSKYLDKYIKVTNNKDFIFDFCKRLDGNYTLSDLKKVYLEKKINFDVEKMIDILCRSGLITNIEDSYIEHTEMEKLSYTIFQIDIQDKISYFKNASRVIFPYIFYPSIILNLISIYYCMLNYKVFFTLNIYQIRSSYFFTFIIIMAAISICLLFHEISHGIVATRYGLVPKKLVFSLYLMVSPVAYLKIPGMYTLLPKKRIHIWLAGMYTNLCLASIFLLLYFFTKFKGNEVFYAIGLTNLICIVMSISPFMPTDGYFIMSTLLKSPNLRKNITSRTFKFIDKNNLLKSAYLILTILIMSTLLITQIVFIIKSIIDTYNECLSIMEFIIKIKMFIIIFIIVIVKKVIKHVKRKV